MKSSKRNIVISLATISFLTACAIESPTGTPSIATTLPPETVEPTNAISTTFPDSNDIVNCIPVSVNPDEIELQGKFVVDSVVLAPFLKNIETKEIIEFWSGNNWATYHMYAISPDRTLIAYRPSDDYTNPPNEEISIVTSDGNELTRINVPDGWGNFIWLDNNRLLVEDQSNNQFSMIVVDIYTDQEIRLVGDYPDRLYTQATVPLQWGYFSNSGILYNSTLTRAIYPAKGDDETINLVDVMANELIASFSLRDYGKFPVWSSDGTKLALISNVAIGDLGKQQDEIFLVVDDGRLIQATHFLETYHEQIELWHLAWSPDNRYVSFAIRNEDQIPQGPFHLAIFDTITGEVREFCNLSDNDFLEEPIVWLPDNTHLILNYNFDLENLNYYAVVLNIKTKIANQIGNMMIGGWVK